MLYNLHVPPMHPAGPITFQLYSKINDYLHSPYTTLLSFHAPFTGW